MDLYVADYEAMKIHMHMELKRTCTFTLPAILEMEIWECCHANNATQLEHAAVAMQMPNSIKHAAITIQIFHSLKHAAIPMLV